MSSALFFNADNSADEYNIACKKLNQAKNCRTLQACLTDILFAFLRVVVLVRIDDWDNKY
jgi:hypothetical protein